MLTSQAPVTGFGINKEDPKYMIDKKVAEKRANIISVSTSAL